MSIKNIPCGLDFPNDVYGVVEIPCQSFPVKYEIDNRFDALFVDRFIPTSMFYPCNYGFINKTLSFDGNEVDILIISPYPLISKSVINCRPIGLLKLFDDKGEDNKVLSVPNFNISNEYNNIYDICDIKDNLLDKISFFFKNYKELERNKWVKFDGWYDVHESRNFLVKSFNNYVNKNK